jgi:hypothetical protein
MIIRVSHRDRHEADLLAQDTVKLLESMGVSPRLENEKQSRIEANRLGFMAEFAVCRLFDAEPPRLNIATDGGVDLWLGDISVDVKFSKTGSLIFDSADKFKANLAVLVTSTEDPECMLLEGWIGKTAFVRDAYAKDFGYGERLVMGSSDLTPMPRLWELIMERKFK